MKDRLGKQFLLKCDGNCTEVLNCDLLFVPDKQNLTLLTSFNILRFSVENYVEIVESLNESSLYPMLKDKLTYGLYRGLCGLRIHARRVSARDASREARPQADDPAFRQTPWRDSPEWQTQTFRTQETEKWINGNSPKIFVRRSI